MFTLRFINNFQTDKMISAMKIGFMAKINKWPPIKPMALLFVKEFGFMFIIIIIIITTLSDETSVVGNLFISNCLERTFSTSYQSRYFNINANYGDYIYNTLKTFYGRN